MVRPPKIATIKAENKEMIGNFLLVKNIIAEETIVAIINAIVARYIEC